MPKTTKVKDDEADVPDTMITRLAELLGEKVTPLRKNGNRESKRRIFGVEWHGR